ANTEQPKVPALEKRLENLVPDAGFLAAVPPRSAKIAPPKANQQSQTAKTADKENALKLAILVFAEGAETIPENAQTVLQKVAAYQKQQQIRVSLRVDRGEKQPLATARLAAIREQLVAYGVPAEMIRLDEQSSSKAAKPLKIPRNQIIIFGEPVTKSQKAG
ncbi:MAG: hypothetical protein ORN98_11045, partial [Alphaproteobacteria bacterium]|nr:hypothetical protein [Alphaproteobacteria bacterium]